MELDMLYSVVFTSDFFAVWFEKYKTEFK